MFKYYITAYVEDKSGYFVGSEQVTKLTVYAINAKEAGRKARSALPEKNRSGRDWVWIVRVDKIEEVLEVNHEVIEK